MPLVNIHNKKNILGGKFAAQNLAKSES